MVQLFRQVAFNVSFFAVVNVILLGAVVLGIIVDRFSSLRGRQEETDREKMNVCFMCDVKRDRIERSSGGASRSFHMHSTQKHNVRLTCVISGPPDCRAHNQLIIFKLMRSLKFKYCLLLVAPQLWHYVYFMIHLKKIHRADMNGLETRIFNMMKVHARKREPDLSWMDLHKLKAYRDADSDPTDTASGSSTAVGSGLTFVISRTGSNAMYRGASEVSGNQGGPLDITHWQSRNGAGAASGQSPTGVAAATVTRI